jgi:ATP citrate (pro-S)-lyase
LKGIVKALREYRDHLIEHKVSVFVRRAGPNYQEGLRVMREVGASLGIPIHVFGPETHMTAIVGMALGIFLCSFPSLDLYVSVCFA